MIKAQNANDNVLMRLHPMSSKKKIMRNMKKKTKKKRNRNQNAAV